MSAGGGTKAVVAALLANLGIMVSKLVAFFITGSSAMLAEAIHSGADSGNQVLLLVGHSRGQRKATEAHPFGYGRERYVYAFLVSVVLFTVGGLFAIYEGIEKVRHPHELDAPMVAVIVLVVAIILEIFSFRTAIIESKHVKGDETWVGFVRHSKTPELPVVLLEDLAALVGLFLALFGVTMSLLTDEPVWDAVGTLAIGALLVVVAVILGIEMKSLLVGEAAAPAQVQAIRAALEGTPNVSRLIHLRTLHLGPDELLVAAKIEVTHAATVPVVAETIDNAEQRVRAEVPIARVIYLEPDVHREVLATT